MGLLVQVYRDNQGDSTNGGVSSVLNEFTVANVEGPFEIETDAQNVLVLVEGPVNSVRLIPAVYNDDLGEWEPVTKALDAWVMFGGNYAGTCDSRFSRATFEITGAKMSIVKIFDRIE
jgi:hypothetical protein